MSGGRARWREVVLAGHEGDADVARAALTDPDPVTRELALGAMQRLGLLDDPTVVKALRDRAPMVRRRAAMLAGGRPSLSLLIALDDENPTVAEAAAWACGEQEQVDDDVLARLITLAGQAADALVREAAVASLGAIGDDRGLAAVVAVCTDKPAVRRRAVLALVPFDGEVVESTLRAALTDRDWQVRQAAEDVLRAGAE